MRALLLVVFADMVAMRWRLSMRLRVKTMSERRVTDMSRERKLDWLSNPRPMALLQKESFA